MNCFYILQLENKPACCPQVQERVIQLILLEKSNLQISFTYPVIADNKLMKN